MQEKELYVNPITGVKDIDEVLKETEAKAKGYLEFDFLMKYLEDESEFVKYFIIDNKKIIVDMKNPTTQYKKKTILDYERVLQTNQEKDKKAQDNISNPLDSSPSCDVDSSSCVSCSG